MSLPDFAADSQAILTADGTPVTLTAPVVAPATVGVAYAAHALHIRIGVTQDGDGFALPLPKSSATLSTAELSALGITNPEVLKAAGWTLTVGGVAYILEEPLIDYALGHVTTILKRSA